MPKYFTYILIDSRIGEPFYVGKGTKFRLYRHFRDAHYCKTHLQRKITKLTIKNVSIKIYPCFCEEEALIMEIYSIHLLGRKDLKNGPLINLTDGGEGLSGYLPTPEHKLKISLSQKGRPKSLKAKRNLSLARMGMTHTEETKQKLRYKKSNEHKQKLSEAHKGKIPWNKGKKNSQIPWNKGKKFKIN